MASGLSALALAYAFFAPSTLPTRASLEIGTTQPERVPYKLGYHWIAPNGNVRDVTCSVIVDETRQPIALNGHIIESTTYPNGDTATIESAGTGIALSKTFQDGRPEMYASTNPGNNPKIVKLEMTQIEILKLQKFMDNDCRTAISQDPQLRHTPEFEAAFKPLPLVPAVRQQTSRRKTPLPQ